MARERFVEAQNRIYELLRQSAKEVERGGLCPEKNLKEMRGGYTIALLPPPRVASMFSLLSYGVAEVVPSVAYRAGEIHTTIGMCGKSLNFAYEASSQQRQILGTLCEAVGRLLEQYHSSAPGIDFNEYLLTPETLLAAGVPNEAFVLLVQRAVEIVHECGLELEPAWGAHATIARFKAPAPPEAIPELLRRVRSAKPPGQSIAAGIAVGYSLWKRSPERPVIAEEELQGQFVIFRRYDL